MMKMEDWSVPHLWFCLESWVCLRESVLWMIFWGTWEAGWETWLEKQENHQTLRDSDSTDSWSSSSEHCLLLPPLMMMKRWSLASWTLHILHHHVPSPSVQLLECWEQRRSWVLVILQNSSSADSDILEARIWCHVLILMISWKQRKLFKYRRW